MMSIAVNQKVYRCQFSVKKNFCIFFNMLKKICSILVQKKTIKEKTSTAKTADCDKKVTVRHPPSA